MSQATEVPISSHTYIGHLDDIQTALKPLQQSKKIKINFHDHFKELAESFKISIKDRDVKFWHNLASGLQFGMDFFYRLETICTFSAT